MKDTYAAQFENFNGQTLERMVMLHKVDDRYYVLWELSSGRFIWVY